MNNNDNDYQNASGWHPTMLAYVEPDEPDQPVETPLGAPPPQQPVTTPPVQPTTPPPAPAPVQPVTPVLPPASTPVATVIPEPVATTVAQPAPVTPVAPSAPSTSPSPAPQPVVETPAAAPTPAPEPVNPPPPPPSLFSSSPDAKPAASEPKKSGASGVITKVAAVLLAVGLVAGGFYGYQQFQNSKKPAPARKVVAAAPSKAPQQKVLGIVDSVRQKVSDLPTDETPTVATVTNLAKLQGQAFFAKAKKGDKVLIYSTAKKAYLYRPGTNEIIQQSEVEVDGNKSAGATASAETQPATASGKPVLKIKF